MSQINLEEKISEKIKYDYRERLKKIQTNIKNNKSISRIDENYLKKVLDIESLPDEFIKKNEILRKNDLQNPSKSYLVNEIIDNQTKKSLKKNLYHDKLKSEVDILKEQNNVISNQKQKFHEKIDEFKKEKEDEVENLQSELKNIKTQMLVEKDNVKKQESEIDNLNVHYKNTISTINDSISVAKKEYDGVIKKRELLMQEMQSLKQNYDIATKLKSESEHDLMSEKNLQLVKTNKIRESINHATEQNKSLTAQINNQVEQKNQNLEQAKHIQQKIEKQERLIQTINNLIAHIEEQKRLTNDLSTANRSYRKLFDEKIISINNMRNLINENFELLRQNLEKNN